MDNLEQSRHQERIVTSAESGERIDVFVASAFPELSRRAARIACEEGRVRVNGKRIRAGSRIETNDVVEFIKLPSSAAQAEVGLAYLADNWQWQAVFEDEYLLVLDKPRGMPSVRLRHDDPVTLADLVAARWPECLEVSGDSREAGLVQRLDYFTSGLILACKQAEAWNVLHRALVEGDVQKSYLALVEGVPERASWTVNLALRAIEGGKKMRAIEDEEATLAEAASSEISIVKSFGPNVSIVRVSSRSTKRHQVRAHLAAAGYPLVGDALYGSAMSLQEGTAPLKLPPQIREKLDDGFILQAESIRFVHPQTLERCEYFLMGDVFQWALK